MCTRPRAPRLSMGGAIEGGVGNALKGEPFARQPGSTGADVIILCWPHNSPSAHLVFDTVATARYQLGRSHKGRIMAREGRSWRRDEMRRGFRWIWHQAKDATEDLVETTKFMMLGLELPPAPLYKDSLETNIIPQVKNATVLRLLE